MDKPLPGHRAKPAIHEPLLAWYDRYRRDLPWRAAPGIRPDPYHVWLSEIMLQQTVVRTVIPYFAKFLKAWPLIEDLASAPLDEVLTAWAGLGYYARARNLHACARAVVKDHGGRFPADQQALQALPGIGPYTAAAIAAIAFDLPASAVDGNIERVMARLFAIDRPLPGAKSEIGALAATLLPDQRCGDYIQALMDLGAGICTPRSPDCPRCPLVDGCLAARSGIAAQLPRRAPKARKPERQAVAFWLENGCGEFLARTRPPRGLLGGMAELPSTPWRDGPLSEPEIASHGPLEVDWRQLPGVVTHTFTHFHLTMSVRAGKIASPPGSLPPGDWFWVARADIASHPFPSVMKKLIAHATRR